MPEPLADLSLLTSLLGHPVLDAGALFVVGFLSGVINTIAGGGSFLTLPLLMALGLGPGMANGTIRLGVVVQNLVSLATFHRRGVRDYAVSVRLAVPMCLGAGGGAWLATQLSDATLKPLFGAVLILWGGILVLRPGRFKVPPPHLRSPGTGMAVLAFLIGIYGGFLQAGVGFPLMALLVMGVGLDAVRANGVKVALVLAFTLLALPIFAFSGNVAWRLAALLAAGTLLGGWTGTRWQLKAGTALVRWFVVVMVVLSGAVMLYK